MRLMILACTLLVASQLVGCGSTSRENQSAEANPPSKARPANPDLLSVDGELFPLSTYFGVCVRYKGVWRAALRNGMLSPHYPTDGEITMPGEVKLKIDAGKFDMWPGTVLKDVPATSPPRRIQIGRDRLQSFVLVSDFDGAGNNRVSIGYDTADADAQVTAIRMANDVVACHVSAVPSKAKSD